MGSMSETALVVEAYEAGIGHAVVALIQERDAEWARATDAETLERLAAQRLAEVEAERDALRAQLDGMTTEWHTSVNVSGCRARRQKRLVGPWVEVE